MDRPLLRRGFWLGLGAWLLAGMAAQAQVNVWIDTDPSIGLKFRDADDGFALIQAFHSPELRVRGISTTYGNASLDQTTAIARDLAARFGTDAGLRGDGVFPGAANADDLGRPTPATRALAAALAERRLTYLALGPLTNLATLLKTRPALAARIERVVFIGGRLPGEHFYLGHRLSYEFHDANFEKDVLAALTILRSPVPLELVPVAASKEVLLTPDDLTRVGREGGASGRFLEDNTRLWLRLWRWLFGLEGGPAFDSMAVLAASHPEELAGQDARAGISADRGRYVPIAGDYSGQRSFLLIQPGETIPAGPGRAIRYDAAARPGAKGRILEALLRRAQAPAASP